jgi:O-antigen/teichoic acid export membrane protein
MTGEAPIETPTSRSHRLPIGWSILSNALAVIIATVASYITLPLSLQRMGPGSYGAWLLLNSAIAFIPMLQAGLPTAAASVLARGVDASLRVRPADAGAARVVFLASGSIVCVLSVMTGLLYSYRFPPPGTRSDELAIASTLIGVSLGLAMVQQAEEALAVVFERHVTRSLLVCGLAGLRVAALALALAVAPTVIGVALAQLFVAIVSYGSFLAIGRQLVATPWRTLRWPSREWLVTLFVDSGYVLLVTIGAQVTQQVTTLVLGSRFGTATVPAYTVPMVLGSLAISLSAAVSAALLPRVSRLVAQGEHGSAEILTVLLFRVLVVLGLVLAFALVAYGDSLLAWWITPAFARQASPFLAPVALSFVLFLPVRSVLFPFELGRGSARLISWSFALSALAAAGLVLFTPVRYGAPMLAWVSATAMALYSIGMVIRLGTTVLFGGSAAHLRFWILWLVVLAAGTLVAKWLHAHAFGYFLADLPAAVGSSLGLTLILIALFLGPQARQVMRAPAAR